MKAIVPFLSFNGNCRDAMTFYQRCIGGALDITTFGQSGVSGQDDWCAFALLTSGSTVLMASDASPETPVPPGSNVWLCFQWTPTRRWKRYSPR